MTASELIRALQEADALAKVVVTYTDHEGSLRIRNVTNAWFCRNLAAVKEPVEVVEIRLD